MAAEGAKQTGITVKKSADFDEWYVQVILKSEMADYSPVSGCMVFRPAAYSVWEAVKLAADGQFKKTGVQNTYFPIFIPERLLQKEQAHVKGFSPEVAWVTQAGDSTLEERLAVRPTSETVMYEVISKWIRSWRDLPLRLNQWNNVVRWEFKHPTPFLRTREFLWNEGHTAFATKEEAEAERDVILGIYKMVTETFLALPGLLGRKTDTEKFAGALASYSIEHLLPDGKAIQGPDFHSDGQNFSKAFEISFVDQKGEKQYAWQNTWAITTREIGVMVAIHSDDRGLVIPPMVAPLQAVIVPIIDDASREEVMSAARSLLVRVGAVCSVKLDDRDYLTAGRKFNEWELKGVPLRIEIGPRDVKAGKVVLVRRDTFGKRPVDAGTVAEEALKELSSIQENLFRKASEFLSKNTRSVESYEELRSMMSAKTGGGIAQAQWCGSAECEEKAKAETGAKIINVPLDQAGATGRCIVCGSESKAIANFAKSY